MTRRNYISCNSGISLPTTILILVLFLVMALAGLGLAHNEQQAQMRRSARSVAFYAAETGLSEALQNWSVPAGPKPAGTSWIVHSGTLPKGASYNVQAMKLDADVDAVHAMYALRSLGASRGGTSQQIGLLVKTLVVGNPIRAALQVKDSVTMLGTSEISGLDVIPTVWNGPYCTQPSDDVPGLIMADTTDLYKNSNSDLYGSPPLDEDPDTSGYYNFGDITFEDLADLADHTLPGAAETCVSTTCFPGDWVHTGLGPEPSYNVDGSCNHSDMYNWGDPLNAGTPCSDWFPIIYAPGNLQITGNKAGQGLLLVEGDLVAKGGTEFYGPVIVKGSFNNEGGFIAYGGVKADRAILSAGNSEVYYSECVVQRAFSHISVAKPRPLMERPWFHTR